MTQLDDLIARARAADVDRAAASRYVRELDRWARPMAAPRRWPWLLLPVFAGALVLVLWRAGDRAPSSADLPVQIGDRVAIVAAPETQYRVLSAERDETTIAVDRGAVTARLWPGARRHRLRLVGGGVTATATGTIYQLAVGEGPPVVRVLEGSVEVRDAAGVHVVPASTSWPRASGAVDAPTGRALRAMAAPSKARAPRTATDDARASTGDVHAPAEPSAEPIDESTPAPADEIVDAPAPAAGEAPSVAPGAAPPTAAPAAPARANRDKVAAPAAAPTPAANEPAATLKDRWHTARLLRSQGKFAPALDACLAIADVRDPTWSPIALLEAARIALGPLADPDRAIALAERVLAEWPQNTLASEARELRCRARTQLGRDCDAP